ncbi:MAG: PAS domain S-box protein [Ardenticatenaceae bacterium]|nr:PAS domain S-box protein [Ardenticatenaceae bacterium]MCB8974658.1 PAS domain S-box protein [Ardenticatenaceae bacterium]
MKYLTSGALRISFIYALFGLLWILISDRGLLYLIPQVDQLVLWQTYKGLLFVTLSTLIIYSQVARAERQNTLVRTALADSEERYRLLFNNNPLPMWVYDLQTLAFLEVNEAAVQKYGYSRNEFLGQTIKDIRPSEDVPLLLEDVANTTARFNFAGEWRHIRKDGSLFMVEIVSHYLIYNGRSARLVVAKDLTEQKRIESEKNSIFQRNQALVQALGEIVYEWVPQKNQVFWQGDYQRILGYSLTEIGSTTESWLSKIHPEDQTKVSQRIDDAAANKKNLDVEYRFLQADGTYRWMHDRGVIFKDAQGQLEKIVGVFLDIHARKQTEEALRQSELRLRRAIEFAPFPTLIHAEDGEVLAISQTWLDITGYAAEAIKTVSDWTELAYGANQEQIMAGIDRLYELDARVDEGAFVIRCKDGSQRIWEFSSAPLGRLSDGRRGVISIAVDTTERREAENQLRLQSSALNAAANGIVITDVNGLIEWANPAFTELTGYTLEEALGRNPRQLVKSGVHDEAFYRQLWETILCGNVWRGELINRRRDGTHYVEEEAITPVFNEKGAITHFIAIKQDITKRKEAEKEREHLYRQERLAAIGQLAAGIAHDFNNLLAVILLYSQLLARSPNLNPKEQGQLTTIGQQAERAALLINQILDFSRRAVFEKRPLDLLVLLKEEVKLLQRTLPENIEIELAYEADTCVILADVTRVEQTIMNLAFNARDAMPEGGTLRFALSQVQVEAAQPPPVAGMSSGAWVKLSVQDTGTGIAPEIIDHIFEPFVTTKEPGKGTGLGLSQVHGIVAQHNGFIDISSRLGQGSLFEIYLPVWQVEPETAVTVTVETAVSGQGQRLLIIEDEPALRSALHASLSLWQYEVLEAPNGEMALAMLQAGTAVDLIISDMIMPKMGGLAFVHALRKLGLTTPVIFITGYPFTSNPADLPALGVKSILPKPLSPTELNQAVAQALSETAKDG